MWPFVYPRHYHFLILMKYRHSPLQNFPVLLWSHHISCFHPNYFFQKDMQQDDENWLPSSEPGFIGIHFLIFPGKNFSPASHENLRGADTEEEDSNQRIGETRSEVLRNGRIELQNLKLIFDNSEFKKIEIEFMTKQKVSFSSLSRRTNLTIT